MYAQRRLYQISRHNLPVVLVFILLLAVRLGWVAHKENLYGDELTSVSIAFGNPGWGDDTFQTGRVYNGSQLRSLVYVDSEEPEEGLLHDLCSLHRDNGDPSHASLYYMALRCALAGLASPDMGLLVWRGCILNLFCFCFSFLAMWLFLNRLFPGEHLLQAFCLVLAFANPVSLSIALFVREYAMAEMFFCLFALWLSFSPVFRFPNTSHSPISSYSSVISHPSTFSSETFGFERGERFSLGWVLAGVAVTSCLVSCGYFNALFVAAGFAFMGWRFIRMRSVRPVIVLLCIAVGAVVACMLMYRGFFNFVIDDRAVEVSDKLRGGGFVANLRSTLSGLAYISLKRIVTMPILLLSFFSIAYLLFRRKLRGMSASRIGGLWLFAVVALWIVAVMWMATWKSERFISSAVPLAMALLSTCLYRLFRMVDRAMPLVAAAVVMVFACLPGSVHHLGTTASRSWRVGAEERIFLYGPDNAEINTLNQLIPYISDRQECVVLKSMDDLPRFSTAGNRPVHVFGSNDCHELSTSPLLIRKYSFNTWMSDYLVKPR